MLSYDSSLQMVKPNSIEIVSWVHGIDSDTANGRLITKREDERRTSGKGFYLGP